MTDIVERLRETSCDRIPFTAEHAACHCRLANEAADRIETLIARVAALEARVKELTEALARANASMDNAVRDLKREADALRVAGIDAYRVWDKAN